VNPFASPDIHHSNAARGWIELGNHIEANEELEKIIPALRAHPDVLALRWQIYSKAGKWEYAAEIASGLTNVAPEDAFGWLHMAYALHELKRTKEAWEVLIPVVDKFPSEYIMRYNLACYGCQLGNLAEAWQWLEEAIGLAGKTDIRTMALDDPDLEPLWTNIGRV
jgi:tetratricopeptide (TPR) repeat protein